MISSGNIKAKAVYYGGLAIKAVYAGAVKAWEKVAGLKNYIIKGNAEVKEGKVVGVGDEFSFNQILPNGNFSEGIEGWYNLSSAAGNVARLVVAGVGSNVNYWRQVSPVYIQGHKYLAYGEMRCSSLTTARMQTAYTIIRQNMEVSANTWTALAGVFTAQGGDANLPRLMFMYNAAGELSGGEVVESRRNMVFDLTAMGIADRVNSLADFKAYLVSRGMMQSVDDELPYFAHDAGATKTSMPLKVMSGSTKVATYPCLISSPLFKVGNVADTAEFATQKVTRRCELVDGELRVRATPIVEDAVLPAVTEWQDGYILTTDTEIQPSEVTTEA